MYRVFLVLSSALTQRYLDSATIVLNLANRHNLPSKRPRTHRSYRTVSTTTCFSVIFGPVSFLRLPSYKILHKLSTVRNLITSRRILRRTKIRWKNFNPLSYGGEV